MMAGPLEDAIADLQAGNFDRAERGFRNVLDREPLNAPALINLAIVKRHLGQLDEAVALFEQAVQVDPGNFRVFANLGVTLQQARRLDDAIAAYRTAYRLEPRAIRQIAVNMSAMGTGTLFLDPDRLEAFLSGEKA